MAKKQLKLFYYPYKILDTDDLRAYARKQVCDSKLIQMCASGSHFHTRALLCGFWPFVFEFQNIIKRKLKALDTRPIVGRFGEAKTREVMRGMIRELREMAREEGDHAELWRRGANDVGITDEQLSGVHFPAVYQLLDVEEFTDSRMFCHLAGTEYIAEELSRRLTRENPVVFPKLFSTQRWSWGDVHLLPHDGPSHLDMDEDLAQAFYPSGAKSQGARATLESQIRETCRMFYFAADEIYRYV